LDWFRREDVLGDHFRWQQEFPDNATGRIRDWFDDVVACTRD
jgi:hypothetical protein